MGNIHYAAGRHADAVQCWRAGLEALGSAGGPVAANSTAAGTALSADAMPNDGLAASGYADGAQMAAVEADRAAVLGNIGIGLARLGRYQASTVCFWCPIELRCIVLAGMNCPAVEHLVCSANVCFRPMHTWSRARCRKRHKRWKRHSRWLPRRRQPTTWWSALLPVAMRMPCGVLSPSWCRSVMQ
jgi:hypothetical protein